MYGKAAARMASPVRMTSSKRVGAVHPVALWWMRTGMIGGSVFLSGSSRTSCSQWRHM